MRGCKAETPAVLKTVPHFDTSISPFLFTVRVENFEVFLISRFSWVADDTKIIHMEGGITTR